MCLELASPKIKTRPVLTRGPGLSVIGLNGDLRRLLKRVTTQNVEALYLIYLT